VQFLLVISHDDAFAPAASLFGEIAAWIEEMEKKGIRASSNHRSAPGLG